MVTIRFLDHGYIQYDISLLGKRFRESSGLPETPANIKKVKAKIKTMNAQIALGKFEYREFFPDSKKCAKFEQLKREKHASSCLPFFDNYAKAWFDRMSHQWKNTYQESVEGILRLYLLPFFGNILLSDITLGLVQEFRTKLCELTNPDGSKRLTNKRINIICVPLISILYAASEEFDMPYPLERLKPLKEEKSDPKPLNQEEVFRFLEVVPDEWRDYYIVRFYTGMRSCEVHGLLRECVDFEHGRIMIRHNWVRKELTDVKTPKSRRDIKMTPTVRAALERAVKAMPEDVDFVFTNDKGKPLLTHQVSKKIWYPTLKKAGLEPRRPYQTRHTAAVLHLAAHENPLFVSRLLGHSGTRMLYDVYAPFIHNALDNDGSAFEAMMQARMSNNASNHNNTPADVSITQPSNSNEV
ncbi:site-specific integrase [Thalassomonas sp. M1454]|uniref:site-specific integrase n=1 Tax=Thalassomonas sp. M1454 TaxID=2594477 RepID=UPI00117FA908|nr:site-specific integrase [Thalassomonas sp. M1454]TRX57180.1 site-specific integrase [Thalassomonas sp. M1454]